MKTMLLALLAGSLTVSAQGGKPSSCTNVPVNITIQDFNPGISSDGGGTYVNGTGGVKAILNCNGQSIELSGTRSSNLNLTSISLHDGTAPAWPTPAPIAFFNIPLGSNFSDPQPHFSTYLKATMANSAGYFYMENPSATAPLNPPDSNVNNSICTTSLVYVDHYPAGTYLNDTTAPETWDVYPDPNPQPPLCVGTLNVSSVGTAVYPLGKGNKTGTAQYIVPFRMLVQRQ